jgi:hypothetical protein
VYFNQKTNTSNVRTNTCILVREFYSKMFECVFAQLVFVVLISMDNNMILNGIDHYHVCITLNIVATTTATLITAASNVAH